MDLARYREMSRFQRKCCDPKSFLSLRNDVMVEDCPHCRRHGHIKSHGFLYGYGTSIPDCEAEQMEKRGLRFFVPTGIPMTGAGEPSL